MELIENYEIEKKIILQNNNNIIKIYDKWKPMLKKLIKIKNNDKIFDEMSLFSEIYSKISDIFKNNHYNMISSYTNDFIPLETALKMIINDIEKMIIYDDDMKLNIVNEYYNVITGERGLLLENGIRVENDKFLNIENQEKVDKKLLNIIERRIEYILSKSKRKILDRELKIKRILKD